MMQTPEETAQTLIANAGFRDSDAIPTAIVKGLLIEALSGAIERDYRILQKVSEISIPQTWPWDRLGVTDGTLLRRTVDAGLSKRISHLETELDAVLR